MPDSIFEYAIRIERFGFRKVLELPFDVADYGDDVRHEMFYVYFHPWGLLLEFDSFSYTTIRNLNGGHCYYQWKPHNQKMFTSEEKLDSKHFSDCYNALSSGGWRTDKNGNLFWCGSHDCRFGFLGDLKWLHENGSFFEKWIEQYCMCSPYLIHHGDYHTDWKNNNYNTTSKLFDKAKKEQRPLRFEMLPENVKDAIGIAFKGDD